MEKGAVGPTGRMEMEKGVVGSHKSNGEGSTSTSDTQAIGSNRSDGHGERPHRFGSHRSDGERSTSDTQVVGSHRSDGEGSTSDMQAVGSHRSDGGGERCCRVSQVRWRRVHKHK